MASRVKLATHVTIIYGKYPRNLRCLQQAMVCAQLNLTICFYSGNAIILILCHFEGHTHLSSHNVY